MNKFLLILAGSMLSLTPPPGEAQAPAPAEPKELEAIRARYQTDAQVAVKPIQLRYISDLKRLMTQATAAGKLEQALGVKAELDAASNGTIANTSPEFEDLLIGSKWEWETQFQITFSKRGEIKASKGENCTWKTLQPYTIEYRYPNGNYGTIVFNHGLTQGTIHETHEHDTIPHTMPLTRLKN